MYVDSYVAISRAIENNLHKQQCIIGLARTCKCNALLNCIRILYCMFTSPHEFGLCTHHVSSSTDLELVGCSRKGPHFLQKNPQQKFLSTGLSNQYVANQYYIAAKPISGINNFPLSPLINLNLLELKMTNRGITWTGKHMHVCDWILENQPKCHAWPIPFYWPS